MTNRFLNSSFYIIILVTYLSLLDMANIDCYDMYNTDFNKIHEYNPKQRLQERNNMKFKASFPISSIIVQPENHALKYYKKRIKVKSSNTNKIDSFDDDVALVMLHILFNELLFLEDQEKVEDVSNKISKTKRPRYCYIFGICTNLFCSCD